MAFRLGTIGRNAAADGLTAEMNTGTIEIYAGAQPGSVTGSPTGAILGICDFAAGAFGSAAVGIATAATISPENNASGSWDAGMFRIREAGGSTTVADGECGEGGQELVFDNRTIIAGGTIDITGFTITVPE